MYYYKSNIEGATARSEYKEEIGECFNYTLDFQFTDMICEELERYYEDELYIEKTVDEILDKILIYDANKWIIMEHYLRPEEANLNDAIEMLYQDLIKLITLIRKRRE